MQRWIQMTDLHIGGADEDTFDIDVRSNFRRVLDAAMEMQPDRLVLTGDLCFRDPDDESYEWLGEQLAALGVNTSVLPGNHDSSEAVHRFFGHARLSDGTLGWSEQHGARQVLFVDTAASELSQAGLEHLQRALAPGAIVFIHHPPLLAGVPFMDEQHRLKNHEDVLRVLSARGHVSVFCGHYHVERTVRCGVVDVFLTPSTFFQISAAHAEFAVDHKRPAFRWIDFDDHQLRTGIEYLEEGRFERARLD